MRKSQFLLPLNKISGSMINMNSWKIKISTLRKLRKLHFILNYHCVAYAMMNLFWMV